MSQRPPSPSTNPPPERLPSDHVGILLAALVMGVLSWAGLVALILTQPPRIGGPLWAFFLLLCIGVACTVLPLVRWINARFTPLNRELPPSGVIVRQSVWFGLYAALCAWLQMPRVLNAANLVLLALAFIGVEVFLRAREIAYERE